MSHASSSYFTSWNTSGAPTGATRSSRRGDSVLTCITTGSCIPEISSRYAENVPAGTVMFSTPATLIVATFVTPSPDENTFRLKLLPSASGSAGRIRLNTLSSTAPAGTVVSTAIVFGVPDPCGTTALQG